MAREAAEIHWRETCPGNQGRRELRSRLVDRRRKESTEQRGAHWSPVTRKLSVNIQFL